MFNLIKKMLVLGLWKISYLSIYLYIYNIVPSLLGAPRQHPPRKVKLWRCDTCHVRTKRNTSFTLELFGLRTLGLYSLCCWAENLQNLAQSRFHLCFAFEKPPFFLGFVMFFKLCQQWRFGKVDWDESLWVIYALISFHVTPRAVRVAWFISINEFLTLSPHYNHSMILISLRGGESPSIKRYGFFPWETSSRFLIFRFY